MNFITLEKALKGNDESDPCLDHLKHIGQALEESCINVINLDMGNALKGPILSSRSPCGNIKTSPEAFQKQMLIILKLSLSPKGPRIGILGCFGQTGVTFKACQKCSYSTTLMKQENS